MGDTGKEFLLARNPVGAAPCMGTRGIQVSTRLHDLEDRTFRPGQGPEFRDFLRGKMNTGERKPRALPGEVANRVAHLMNRHRSEKHQEGKHGTAYIVQLYGRGSKFVRWSLERLSLRKAARFAPLKTDPTLGPAIREARAQGRHEVLKSEMDNLRIRRWHRELHYRIYVTAFAGATVSAGEIAMEDWRRRYGHLPLWRQSQARKRAQPSEQQALWLDTMGWQKLPEELIARLKNDARTLVFPSAFKQIREAVKRSSGGPLLAIPLAGYQLVREDDRYGPANCVWTQYHAYVHLSFCTKE